MGVLLDASAQHPGRRGRETLAVSAQTIGVDARRVDDLLGLVGLDRSAARKRVRQYSLGMRQRLGLAHALLGDPEVLILDEPANGLDPEGMRWMRGLLRDFADRGGTVLLSSHLLNEVQAVADRIVIIGAGRIVAQGSRDELLADAGTLVAATDVAALAVALATPACPARAAADGRFVVDADPEAVGHAALAGGVALTHLGPAEGAGLEQLFFDLTGARPTAPPVRPPGDDPMNAATLAAPLPRRADTRPGLGRLTAVELRKMTDTRAGFWLQFAIVVLTVLVVVATCIWASPEDQTLRSMLSIAVAPASVLLPIVGILLVSSEWSQRTAMTTFALVPRRPRVLAAKLLASVVLSLVALALCVVVAVVGTAVAAPGLEHTWSLPAR